ncbi:DUF6538 domain-containing protein [Limnobacter sp.]|uniref:phage integrase n=1 Tax=Limnobacter sp. TaxID=2003368 RepID=UPI002586297A|nr:DUF6538 domain-containing protein [Limnobacter sp.]
MRSFKADLSAHEVNRVSAPPQSSLESPRRALNEISSPEVRQRTSEQQKRVLCTSNEVTPRRGSSQPRKVAGTPYLFIRSGTYYFKRKIPADAQGAFPNLAAKQIWRSLDTDMLHVAMVRLKAEVSLFDETVARYRRHAALQQLSSMNVGIRSSTGLLHADSAHVTSPTGLPSNSEPQVGCQVHANGVEKDNFLDVAQVLQQLRSLVQAVEQLAIGAPSHAVPQSTAKTSVPFSPQIAATKTAATMTAATRVDSDIHVQNGQKPRGATSAPTLYLLFEDWKLTQTRHRTVAAVENALQEFARCVNNVVVEQLTRNQARAYRDKLIEKGLSKSTIENRLGFLATLFRHGQRELTEHLHINPFERIEIRAQPTRAPKNRRAFESTELNRILQSKLYSKGYTVQGQPAEVAYWLPLLGMFTGARFVTANVKMTH